MSDEEAPDLFSQIMGRNHLLGEKSKSMEYMTAQSSSEAGLADKILALNDAGWNAVGDMDTHRLPANLVKKTRGKEK